MKVVVVDIYDLNMFNSKIPKRFRNYDAIWDFREALMVLWTGKVKTVALPKDGVPGYDYEDFIDKLLATKQINKKPKIEYYKMRRV